MSPNKTILVTGGTGFLASHTLLHLTLTTTHSLRTTVRTLKRRYEVIQMLENGGATPPQAARVEILAADLTSDAGWDAACAGCDYVLHLACLAPILRRLLPSPITPEAEIQAAVAAVLRVLHAAQRQGVKRVVLASSLGTVMRARVSSQDAPYTEADWAVEESAPTQARFGRRRAAGALRAPKIAAERAAWEWYATEAGSGVTGPELTVLNPCTLVGPILGERGGRNGGSRDIVRGMFNAVGFGFLSPTGTAGFVDVRDVAAVFVRAMAEPRAVGNRYIVCATDGPMRWGDVADMLKEDLAEKELTEAAAKVGTERPAKAELWLMGFLYGDLLWAAVGKKRWALQYVSSKKAEADLDWKPRSTREATLACAESLIEFGMVPEVVAKS